MTIAVSQDWTLSAKCNGMGDFFFVETVAEQRNVARFCTDCPVRRQCLAEALEHNIEFGVWGGTTERDRRRMQFERQHPQLRRSAA